MTMFAKAIEKTGLPPYRMPWYQRVMANLLPLALKGPVLWVAALRHLVREHAQPGLAAGDDARQPRQQ
ncbi:P-aminobenzoate N-oxygenase AurF [Mycobacteroides abscessus subsp. abscessus]|nr:P-aminobenzoate N-oxygenase AurF [Mycobacteroides abscessus subsp. abscessus]